ncbi:hypothetical protein [Saccharothrix xinjiangensis]|uniref:Circularly permuted ATP-grasp superfamily protein n=1 Tax=Saccharothrix xinjiangensis TaxID=204798 RepID=A0ABV9XXJ0_9PSEU
MRALLHRDEVRRGGELFPTAPVVAVLHPLAEPVLRQRVHNAVRCLEQVVRGYPRDRELQEFLDVPPVMRRWVLAEPEPEGLRVDLCRLDLLGGTLGTVRVLEFNASSPGGVIPLGVISRRWRESSLGALLADWGAVEARFEEPNWFADWLLDHGRDHAVPEGDCRRVGLFHDPACAEIDPQAHVQLRRRGCSAVALDPAEFVPGSGLRLGYLKHIPVAPRAVEGWQRFCAALTDKSLVVPNALAARWVAENKLCLAVLSDPRFRHLFTARQQEVLDAIVPFSRKLGDGVSPAEAVADQQRLVLKAPYGRCGESVVIGRRTPRDEWARLVRDDERRGWLVQEVVEAAEVEGWTGQHVRDLVVPVLNGRVLGFGSRIGRGALLNVARGNAISAVFGSHDPAAGTAEAPRTR